MSGKKYKVMITNAGVGDPFILLKAQFVDSGEPPSGGSWSLPSEHPINGFSLEIAFCGGDSCGAEADNFNPVGVITVERIATDSPYYFGLPFDQGGFTMGSDLSLMLRAKSSESGDLVYLYGDDLGSDHLTYFQQFTYANDAMDFESIMVYYKWQDS